MGKSGDHESHLPIPEGIEVATVKEKVKERVLKETTAIRKIYDTVLLSAGLSEAALSLVSSVQESSM